MNFQIRNLFAVVIVSVGITASALAQTAGMQHFQGLIRDSLNEPISSPVDLQFRIYDAAFEGNLVDMDGDGLTCPSTPGECDVGQDVKQVNNVVPLGNSGIVSTKFGPIAPTAFSGDTRWLEVSLSPAGMDDWSTLSRVEMATPPATAEQLNARGTGSPAVVALPNGNVGIGTLSPGQKLEVSGNGSFSGSLTAASLAGNGSSLTSLNATNLTSGTLPNARLSGTYSNALTLSSASNSFTGNGSGLTSLNATNLTTGTVADARLSSNIPRKNTNNTFSGTNEFGNPLELTSALPVIDFHFGNDPADYNARIFNDEDRRLAIHFKSGSGAGLFRVFGNITASGSCCASDRTLKKNIFVLTGVLTKLLSLRGVAFEWSDHEKVGGAQGKQIGLIAQEVEQVFPELVVTDTDGIKFINTYGFPALTVEAIRELKHENDTLRVRVEVLERRLAALEKFTERVAK